MHQQQLNQLISTEFTKQFTKDSTSASTDLASLNSEQIKNIVSDNLRIPTGDDIRQFKNWEMKYRTDNPKASDRQVRRAIISQFNITVINGQNMIPKN